MLAHACARSSSQKVISYVLCSSAYCIHGIQVRNPCLDSAFCIHGIQVRNPCLDTHQPNFKDIQAEEPFATKVIYQVYGSKFDFEVSKKEYMCIP